MKKISEEHCEIIYYSLNRLTFSRLKTEKGFLILPQIFYLKQAFSLTVFVCLFDWILHHFPPYWLYEDAPVTLS